MTRSYDGAILLARTLWEDFTLSKSGETSGFDEVFGRLREIAAEPRDFRFFDDSIPGFRPDAMLADYEDALVYRHLRDFGSLLNLGSPADDLLNRPAWSLLRRLCAMSDQQIRDLASEIGKIDVVRFFLEDDLLVVTRRLRLLLKRFGVPLSPAEAKDAVELIAFLRNNLELTLEAIPLDSLRSGGLSKMLRIMVGVGMYTHYAVPVESGERERRKRVLNSLKIGYYFGISHPLVDNVLDSGSIMTRAEKQEFGAIIADALSGADVSRQIPRLPLFEELHRCCSELVKLIPHETNRDTYCYLTIAHRAQMVDSAMTLEARCRPEDLFVPIVIKAAFIRIAAASLAGVVVDDSFVRDCVLMGLNNQLSNDFEGYAEDRRNGIATPFTLFLAGKSGINPLSLTFQYLLYFSRQRPRSEKVTRALLLRFVETVHEFVRKNGAQAYRSFIDDLVDGGDLAGGRLLLHELGSFSSRAPQVHQEAGFLDWVDESANRYVLERLRRKPAMFDLERFRSSWASWIETTLLNGELSPEARYALGGTSKRNRPLLCLLMAQIYGLPFERIAGLVRAVEYFHTASLIFDDLPAQDNAWQRRGQPALHRRFGESTAQIAAVSLLLEGYRELAGVETDEGRRLDLIRYGSEICGTKGVCLGQMRDLRNTRGEEAGVEELVATAHLKTGKAIEFCLVSVASIAEDSARNIDGLKELAFRLGVAYQIRDDLRDLEPSSQSGKDRLLDKKNGRSTFLSVLGPESSRTLLGEYEKKARDALGNLELNTLPLEAFVNVVVRG